MHKQWFTIKFLSPLVTRGGFHCNHWNFNVFGACHPVTHFSDIYYIYVLFFYIKMKTPTCVLYINRGNKGNIYKIRSIKPEISTFLVLPIQGRHGGDKGDEHLNFSVFS